MDTSEKIQPASPESSGQTGHSTAGKPCPDCASTDTRLSHKRNIWTGLLGLFNFSRFKCRTCGRRFYASN